jgi:acetylglutamate kinase
LPVAEQFGENSSRIAHLVTVVRALGVIAAAGAPVVVVHGGGKRIDAALNGRPREAPGRRPPHHRRRDARRRRLGAGSAVNTRLVAALTTAGIAAVGLTGADGACGWAAAAPHRAVDGRIVDLGRVSVRRRHRHGSCRR